MSPAFAQRYPPFPIGGGSASGAGGTTSPSTSGSASEFFNPGGSAGSNSASASGAPDDGVSVAGASIGGGVPACDLATCLHYAGQVGSGFVVAKVQELGRLRVGSFKGCCAAFARIDVFMESERVFLGTVHAKQDGSYFGEFTLPASIEPGRHHIVADIEGCGELKGAIDVVAAGVSVLGTTTLNTSATSGASGSGVLPRTGSDLLQILVLALILIAIGTVLIAAMRRFGSARAHTGRVPGSRAIAALPRPEVPVVDTSNFVPSRPAPGQRLALEGQGTRVTEWRARTDRVRDR